MLILEQQLIEKIINWAGERDILAQQTLEGQFEKVTEKIGDIVNLIEVLKNAQTVGDYTSINSRLKKAFGKAIVKIIIFLKLIDYDFENLDHELSSFKSEILNASVLMKNSQDYAHYLMKVFSKKRTFDERGVVSILLHTLKSYDLLFTDSDALEIAYDELKSSKGRMINGVFDKNAE